MISGLITATEFDLTVISLFKPTLTQWGLSPLGGNPSDDGDFPMSVAKNPYALKGKTSTDVLIFLCEIERDMLEAASLRRFDLDEEDFASVLYTSGHDYGFFLWVHKHQGLPPLSPGANSVLKDIDRLGRERFTLFWDRIVEDGKLDAAGDAAIGELEMI